MPVPFAVIRLSSAALRVRAATLPVTSSGVSSETSGRADHAVAGVGHLTGVSDALPQYVRSARRARRSAHHAVTSAHHARRSAHHAFTSAPHAATSPRHAFTSSHHLESPAVVAAMGSSRWGGVRAGRCRQGGAATPVNDISYGVVCIRFRGPLRRFMVASCRARVPDVGAPLRVG